MADIRVKPPELAVVSTATLATLMAAKTPMVILDARSPDEDEARIPGAKNLDPDCSEADAARAIGRKDALIVTYCSNTQCPLSFRLFGRLKSLGYENVLEYQEGIAGWAGSHYPVHEIAGAQEG